MPFKCEMTYVVRKPFKYDVDTTFEQGDEYPWLGTIGDGKLQRTGYVDQFVKYHCRKPRCKKIFDSVPELLEHERSHDE